MVEDGSTRKRRHREQEPAATTSRLHGLRTYFDAAALLTVVTVILYFCGFIYVKSYFDSAGVSLSHFDLPAETYLLATWTDLLETGIWILPASVGVSILHWIFFNEKNIESGIAWIRKKILNLPEEGAHVLRRRRSHDLTAV